LHLWDSESKKEKRTYTEKNHLSHKIISFVYKSYENGALGPFAVSNDDGTIILWDLVRGVVSKVISCYYYYHHRKQSLFFYYSM